jgi:hypothetical protein
MTISILHSKFENLLIFYMLHPIWIKLFGLDAHKVLLSDGKFYKNWRSERMNTLMGVYSFNPYIQHVFSNFAQSSIQGI